MAVAPPIREPLPHLVLDKRNHAIVIAHLEVLDQPGPTGFERGVEPPRGCFVFRVGKVDLVAIRDIAPPCRSASVLISEMVWLNSFVTRTPSASIFSNWASFSLASDSSRICIIWKDA